MKHSRRIAAILLAVIMLLGLFGCSLKNRVLGCAASLMRWIPQTTQQPEATESQATEHPTPNPTEQSVESPTEAPTEAPKELTPEQKAAEEAFWALDEELFLDRATSDITSLDQYCENPLSFGIDESTVPVTLGEFTEEENDKWIEECMQWREKLNAIDRSLLSDQLQFAYDTYCRYFDMEIESKDWFYNYEPLDEFVGLHMNMPLLQSIV